MKRRQLNDEQEKQIRMQFFMQKIDPKVICKAWGISENMLRRVVGGPIYQTNKSIERAYYGQ